MQEQNEIIRALPVTEEERAALTGMGYAVGTRYFAESVLNREFPKEKALMKQTSWVQEWIRASADLAAAEGLARGDDAGHARGEARGEAKSLLRFGSAVLGEPEAGIR